MMFCTLIIRDHRGAILDTIEAPEGETMTAAQLRAVLISRAEIGARTIQKVFSEEVGTRGPCK